MTHLGSRASLWIRACAIAIAFGLGASGGHAAETLTIAHLYPESLENNDVAPALHQFKMLVEKGTGGAIEVEIFGAGALGSEVETGKQAQNGRTVQSVLLSSGAMSSFYKRYQIVATPFLFDSYAQAWGFFDSPWFADFMRGTIETSGLRYLGTFDDGGGFVAMTNNKRLIKTVDDFAGLNIRVEENPAHIATMRALGASATPLPWGEVATALATGLADGQFNAPIVSAGFKLWEVNDYTTWTGHVYNTLSWMTQSCEKFDECHVLEEAERVRMRGITRPAFKEWITGDFGIPAAEVEALWAEADRVNSSQKDGWAGSYLK
jgi:TRAP-type C4-dicarboxylate transport system substrate-binding protein